MNMIGGTPQAIHWIIFSDVLSHAKDCFLVFRVAQTHSLDISSLYLPFYPFLAELPPLPYSLRAGIDNLSVVWQDNFMTEWINPHYGYESLQDL
jgi:hypothetical protein